MTTSRATTGTDGRHDFDFLHGTWRVALRRLADPLRPDVPDWADFEALLWARPLLGGLGNVESISGTGGVDFDGATLRLFDPGTRTWRIWWASTSAAGRLDPPMEGRFDGPSGRFFGRDTVRGTAVDLRFDWHVDGPDTARWAQAFSFDGGASWSENFTMRFTRTGA
jgi:hypothetical protein